MKALLSWLIAITVFCIAAQSARAAEFDRQGYGMRPTGSGTYQFSPLVDLMRNNYQHTPLLDRMARENRTPTADARADVSKQGSNLVVGQRGKFKPPGTKDPVIVDVEAKVIKNPAFGMAVAKFARTLPLVGNALAVYDLFSGWDIQHEVDDGQHVYFRFIETFPQYNRDDHLGNFQSGPYPSATAACNVGVRDCSNDGTVYSCSIEVGGPVVGSAGALQCVTTFTSKTGGWAPAPQVRDRAEGIGTPGFQKNPLTDSDIADAVQEADGWGNPNWDEVVRDMLDAGQKVPVEDVTVTGPTSAPGPTTTTTENRTGTNGDPISRVTTTTTNNNITYNNSTVNISSVSNTTITENGVVVSESETTTEPETPDEETATDTGLPPVPDLYEQKYPDGLLGVWNSRKSELTASPLLSLLAQLMPTIAPGGTCPQWLVTVDVGVANFGTHDVSIPCDLWPILAAFVIVSALLLARRLIFGG